jgi:hypothetical protein
MTTTETRRQRTIPAGKPILNRDAFKPEIIKKRYGCDNLTQLAKFLGVHRTTMMRAYTREADIGGRLMNALLDKTGRSYHELFTTLPLPVTVSLPRDTEYDPGDWPPGGPHGIGV